MYQIRPKKIITLIILIVWFKLHKYKNKIIYWYIAGVFTLLKLENDQFALLK